MKPSALYANLFLVFAVASAASIPSRSTSLAAKLVKAGLRPEVVDNSSLTGFAKYSLSRKLSTITGRPSIKLQTKARPSVRQVDLPISGDGLYDECNAADEDTIEANFDCLDCLLGDECSRTCCASMTSGRADSNQAIFCEIGKCCTRVMLDLEGDAIVLSVEPVRAMSKASDSTCADFKETNSCGMCSVVYPEGFDESATYCPYEMPAYSSVWDASTECANGGGGASSNEGDDTSVTDESSSGGSSTNGEGAEIPTVTSGDAECACSCLSGETKGRVIVENIECTCSCPMS